MLLEVKHFSKNDLDKGAFTAKYEDPALLKGACSDWKATKQWNLATLPSLVGQATAPISYYKSNPHQPSNEKQRVKVADYLHYLSGAERNTNLTQGAYLAGWHFLHNAPQLKNDLNIPPYFQNNLLDKINGQIINYDHSSLFIGHQEVESPLHTDSFFVSVWLACIEGSKHLRIIKPINYHAIKNGMNVFDQDIVDKLDDQGIDIYDVKISKGDIIYIPPGHWHQVRNMGFNIALSVNHLDPQNFLVFEQQLKAKILRPYLKLLEMKREIIEQAKQKKEEDDLWNNILNAESLRHSNFKENENKFINYIESQLAKDKNILQEIQ